MNKKAFTLIELLVVIAIIGIIGAFLLPAFGRARENHRQSMCASNLHQIGIAMHMYLDDHDFKFPEYHYRVAGWVQTKKGKIWRQNIPKHWYHKLEPYIDDRDVFKCPSYKYHEYAPEDLEDTGMFFSYGYNKQGLSLGYTKWGLSLRDINEVKNASQCIMVGDGAGRENPRGSYSYIEKNFISKRHSNGTNILFVDNHIKWYRTFPPEECEIPMDDEEALLWWNY